MSYKFPSDLKEEELEKELEEETEDILIQFLNGHTQESGSRIVLMPENEYYKKIQYHFRRGVLSGLQYVYNENGDRIMTVQFVNGKRNGFYVKHHDNGVIACTGSYKDGLPIGIWKFYNETGEHTSTHKYK